MPRIMEADADTLSQFVGVKEDDAEEALTKFRAIVTAEAGEPSKWQVIEFNGSRWP